MEFALAKKLHNGDEVLTKKEKESVIVKNIVVENKLVLIQGVRASGAWEMFTHKEIV